MSKKVYGMKAQLAIGEAAEDRLDTFFEQWYKIDSVDRDSQRKGIDRIMKRGDNDPFTVEYKADNMSHKTGNAFMELMSRVEHDAKGWVYTCQADYLVYYVVGRQLLYMLKPDTIRDSVDSWGNYPTRKCWNKTYHSVGILLPLHELGKIAINTIQLNGDTFKDTDTGVVFKEGGL